MRKLFRIVTVILFASFLGIQFFQPKKNNGTISGNHILKMETVPENIQVILKNACFDCHSNQTNYLWYNKIAPVSWLVNKHIVAGKKELNFSDWGKLNAIDKVSALVDIYDEVERKKMPLKEYTALHKKAKLSDEQIKLLCDWTEETGAKIMSSISE